MDRALVTGAAGFIGSHLAHRLLADGWQVTGLDNFEPYYDPARKRRNAARLSADGRFRMVEGDVRRPEALAALGEGFDVVVHLAAKVGVRPSLDDPLGYQETNVIGTVNMLELARRTGVRQFVLASSSSVYGDNPRLPWREEEQVLTPISPYAATKISAELMGHVYSSLYGMRVVALRFFTVFGPRQRPDLAIHKFARSMRDGKPVTLYGDGSTRRDYTFVADIVEGVVAGMRYTATPFEVVNLGNGNPVALLEMVEAIEEALGLRAKKEFLPAQPGDVKETWADTGKARRLFGYRPSTSFRDGLAAFAEWFRSDDASAEGVRG